MFKKILGKGKTKEGDGNKEHKELVSKIEKMNLTDMKTYVNNKVLNFEVDENGLNEVMRRILKVDNSKRFIEIDDMDSKIKKGFDLVLGILRNKKLTITTVELVNEFLELYIDIIKKYDQEHKDIYSTRFKDSIVSALSGINAQSELNRKMKIIG